ncbi:DUF397 domain-containing protein [Rugosimonospora africana]|uniref:DUF397 domain-containing protein n=1 Tax=Rugosimonospora africana TaxID=556532 RepID=UPI0019441BDE|nr:DUF397 domain-containing protein [Rugosimonospora africana]
MLRVENDCHGGVVIDCGYRRELVAVRNSIDSDGIVVVFIHADWSAFILDAAGLAV